ncbi:MAG: MFS transporter [bacterium]|nr:MFS transporter [bacterium]
MNEQPITTTERILDWFGLKRNILVMLLTILIIGMGEELWVRFIPKYLELLGASVWIIAFYGTLKDILDALYQYPGGWLADKLGRRIALIIFICLAILGYICYLISPTWVWVLLGTLLVMSWSSLTLPAIFAIIGDNLPKSRRVVGFSMQSILKRVPIVLAPPLGGALLGYFGFLTGMKFCLGITIILSLISIYIVHKFYVEKVESANDSLRFSALWRNMDKQLKRLLVSDILARWAEGIPKVFIILYLFNLLKVAPFQYGWLTSIQMLTAILIYIPIAKLADITERKPFVLLTFIFFAVFPLLIVTADKFFPLTLGMIIAFIAAGLREIGEPARKALIVDLAQSDARARAVGVYYLIRGFIVFPASLVGGWLWTIKPEYPFYIAFIIGMLGVIVYAVSGPGGKSKFEFMKL